MLTAGTVLGIFEKVGALQDGHFMLSSGFHSDRYLQCALVTQHPEYAARLADGLAEKFQKQRIDVVLGPALGGIVIAQEVAQALHRASSRPVRAIFCERVDGKLTLRRGFSLLPNEHVLVVEDVVTTGGSVKETVDLAKAAGATVVGVGSFVDRSTTPLALGAPLQALLKVQAAIYTLEQCPLCKDGLPITKPGSRGLK
jgi:orotate phosphoribosyltransferase